MSNVLPMDRLAKLTGHMDNRMLATLYNYSSLGVALRPAFSL
jgi:hypothetical protein